MTNFVKYESEGIEIVIDSTTGESFATQSGYARMSGKDRSTIVKRCTTCEPGLIKSSEIVTTTGLKTCELIPESIIAKWIVKDNSELAEKLMLLGTRGFLHKLAGYEVKSSAIAAVKPKSTADMLIMFAEAFKEHEQRLSAIELENIELKKQIAEQKHEIEVVSMESEANTHELERFRNGHGYWYSIAGYCHKLGIKKSLGWMNSQGRMASALCKSKGLVPEKISDPRWGKVNSYPDSILMELTWEDFEVDFS